jgi:Lon protease-like protein
MAKLPDIIPIFPLPNVVFFPRMSLPLHIFEPRYRAMVRDAVRGARLIGIVLLRADWEQDYGGSPGVFGVGTVGELVRSDELPDGRFDIVLRGVREFVIHRELARAPYREAVVSWRDDPGAAMPTPMRSAIGALVLRYLQRTGRADAETALAESGVDDETFVNFLAQHLDLDMVEKQALLEAGSLLERAGRLADVLEFRLEELRLDPDGQSMRRPH